MLYCNFYYIVMNSLKFSIVKDLRFGLRKPKVEMSTFKHYSRTFI